MFLDHVGAQCAVSIWRIYSMFNYSTRVQFQGLVFQPFDICTGGNRDKSQDTKNGHG